MSRTDLQDKLNLLDKRNFKLNYLLPALNQGLIKMTIPEKPNSNKQKYRLTARGQAFRFSEKREHKN